MALVAERVKVSYFSGYIRNWRSLCDELGVDTSLSREERELRIIEQAYLIWGVRLTERLCGAFAIVLRDNDSDRTYCIRDHVGQKQLFYAVCSGELLCSGDIDEIASDPLYIKRLNMRMLQQYLFYGYPIGGETFYEGIYKLRPGHYAVFDGSEVSVRRYWRPTFDPDESRSADDFAEELRCTVDEIMGEERADTALPYKESFLSGGVDSSYLLAAGDAQCANTVGYEESGFDESALARRTAEALGKGFRVKLISPEEYFDRIPTVMDKLGQPLGDASAVAFSLGCQAVAEHAKVVYSGEGIDEFFGGYNAHKREMPEEWTYLTCSHIMSEDVVRSLMRDCDPDVRAVDPVKPIWDEVKDYGTLQKRLAVDISLWLEGDIYLNTDRTSTACGVELHTPFSDRRLFDVARRIPTKHLLVGEQNKYAFRKAAASRLPEEAAYRKKVGFPVPIRRWLSDPRFNKPVREKLFGPTAAEFFNKEAIADLWTRYTGGEEALWGRVYAIYAFLLWFDLKF